MLREKRQNQLKFLEQENRQLGLTEKQREIESHQQKIKRMKSQMDMVTTEKEQHALESQIALLQTELNDLEEHFFSSLERQEAIEEEKKDIHHFLEGSLSSLAEIKKDVEVETKKYQDLIDGRQKRIESLEELCEPQLKSFYLDLEKKFKPQRPVAFLIDKKCSQCHMQVDSIFKASLEEGRSYETCPNCGRLLIPETAKIY
ncbi:MAG: zinc ribbon domain-containing protein [Bacteriovorax sp.]